MDAPELMLPSEMSTRFTPLFPQGGFDDLDVIAAARTSGCVLFTGPPDAKGMALRIHSLSGWRWGPFVSVDCGASERVLDRQLFDRLRGGNEREPGPEPWPELMQDGTIFLYEVGKLSMSLQARLADALTPHVLAGRRGRVRKRVMASTSEPLLDRVLAGTFDDRLFYRLNAIHFVVPSRKVC